MRGWEKRKREKGGKGKEEVKEERKGGKGGSEGGKKKGKKNKPFNRLGPVGLTQCTNIRGGKEEGKRGGRRVNKLMDLTKSGGSRKIVCAVTRIRI